MTSDTETSSTPKRLKVIGAGFGRTGTLSIRIALEELGFGPCYHMTELYSHLEHVPLWEEAVQGKAISWEQVFAGYQATIDWPGCAFYEQLIETYPEAKVLLTVRDPDTWYDSTRATIYNRPEPEQLPPHLRGHRRLVNALIWEKIFGNNFEDREQALAIFHQHNEQVRQRVAPEKLLVYQVKEGWEPLCAFLGVEVPKGRPFPHFNERATFLPGYRDPDKLNRIKRSRSMLT